jgi:hypothetical protein
MKTRYFILILVMMLINFQICFGQKKNNKKANPITQKADTLNNKGFYKVIAYFSGKGLEYVKPYNCFGSDLNLLMKNIDSASNGAFVTIETLIFISPNKPNKVIENIPYKFNQNKQSTLVQNSAKDEVDKLRMYNFVSGTIYFGGEGFLNVSSVNAKEKITLNNFYDRCMPGSSITLDNCIFKNENGSLSEPISKNIKLK